MGKENVFIFRSHDVARETPTTKCLLYALCYKSEPTVDTFSEFMDNAFTFCTNVHRTLSQL